MQVLTVPFLLAATIPPAHSGSVERLAVSVPLVTDPAGLLAVLLAVLAGIFFLANHKVTGRFFKIVPSLVFCYFVPTLLTTAGVIPAESELYTWVKNVILPAALLLLILALDLPGSSGSVPRPGSCCWPARSASWSADPFRSGSCKPGFPTTSGGA